MLACVFKESCSLCVFVHSCSNAGSRRQDEGAGMGPCQSRAWGPRCGRCTGSGAELGCDGCVTSQNGEVRRCRLQKDWVCFGLDCPGEMGLFGMISNEAGVHPPASSNFIWTSLFSSPRFAPPQPLLPPSLPSQVVWEGSSHSHYVESISRGLWRLLLP